MVIAKIAGMVMINDRKYVLIKPFWVDEIYDDVKL